jgi:exopolysaccharide biosynthesis polyprenyl glycosylphosphotransferase
MSAADRRRAMRRADAMVELAATQRLDDEVDAEHQIGTDRLADVAGGVPFAARPQGRTWSFTFRMALMALDAAVIISAVIVALLFRFNASPLEINGVGFNLVGVAMILLWMGLLVGNGCYDHRVFGVGADEFKRIFVGTVQMAGITAIVAYLADFPLARGFLVLATPIGLAGLLFERYAARKYLHRLRRDGAWSHRVVLVGDEVRARELLRNLTRDRHAGLRVVGACLTGEGQRVDFLRPDVPVVGGPEDISEAIVRLDADTVAVTTSRYFGSDDLRRLAWSLEGTGVDVIVAPALTDVAGPRIHIRPVAGLPLLHLEEPDYRGGRQLAKAVFDRVSALVMLVALSPVMLVIAALIRMTSDGPALFRQQRVGRNGNVFTICKFRTMHDGADARFLELVESQSANRGGMFVKNRNDPRVTPLGAILRRFSLDELPQLLNVVRGEMSLVGPRPLPVAVVQDGVDVRRRLLVRPGITGLWQVSGRSELPWEEAVRLDLYYVENWSLSFDLLILWKTVRVAFLGDGAY